MKPFYRLFFAAFIICISTMFYSCEDCDCGCGCKDCPNCNHNCCMGCHGTVPPPPPPLMSVSASFSKDLMTIYIGETNKQSVTTNCPDAEIVYFSSDLAIATVDSSTGEVTGLSKGRATITATVTAPKGSEKYEGSCTVSYQVEVDARSLGTVSMYYGANLSSDFLELITPVVTYRDKEGEHEVRLDKQVCRYDRQEIALDDEVYVYETYRWTPEIICNMYGGIEFDETISMRFEPNKVAIDPTRQYDLHIAAGVPTIKSNFFYNGTYYINTYNHWSISLDINIGDGESHDDDIYEGESVQKYIDTIVQTKLDVRVEVSKDGKVIVNGE